MQWNAFGPTELSRNVIKSASLGLRKTKHGVGEGEQGHTHEEEVHVRPTQFLETRFSC